MQTRQKCTTELLKKSNKEVCALQRQCNKSDTLYEAFQGCHEIFPDATIILEIIKEPLKWSSHRKRVFVNKSYRDFVNHLRSSMNIQMLNALI